tara:strand:- start:7074 stop:7955 length:882 start_codon:yes stop_codon:yes gene_type:complete
MCAIGSIYIFSEILKLAYSHDDKTNYHHCVNNLRAANLDGEDVFKICAYLNNVASLQTFANDFAKALMVIFVLFGATIDRDMNISYWAVSHLSALGFSYLGTKDIFQFSFDSHTKYDSRKILIACLFVSITLPLMIWNSMKKNIATRYILGFLAYYMVSYLLYSRNDIEYHLHHSFVCTFLSYFCTDWSSRMNIYSHSVLMGIAVQGLAFYAFDEYNVLNISNRIDVTEMQITIFYIPFWTYLIYNLVSKVECRRSRSQPYEEHQDHHLYNIEVLASIEEDEYGELDDDYYGD